MTDSSDGKILCLDFDGVLHSYVSGWNGPRTISDPPVYGAIPWLLDALDHFDVHILSSRSHCWGGRTAMRRWLRHWIAKYQEQLRDQDKIWALADLHLKWAPDELAPEPLITQETAKAIVKAITFPRHKPPAHVTLDDRAWHFDGKFPGIKLLKEFAPWNRTPGNNPPHEKPELEGARQ